MKAPHLEVWLASPRGKFLEERERELEHTTNTAPAVAKKPAALPAEDRKWPTAEDVTASASPDDDSDDMSDEDLNAIDLHGRARAAGDSECTRNEEF